MASMVISGYSLYAIIFETETLTPETRSGAMRCFSALHKRSQPSPSERPKPSHLQGWYII
jgi:hypothetical protein